MRYAYDDEADALYIHLQEGVPISESSVVDDGRSVDLDAGGAPVGIEILAASAGVRVLDLVDSFGLAVYVEHLRAIEGSRFTAVA